MSFADPTKADIVDYMKQVMKTESRQSIKDKLENIGMPSTDAETYTRQLWSIFTDRSYEHKTVKELKTIIGDLSLVKTLKLKPQKTGEDKPKTKRRQKKWKIHEDDDMNTYQLVHKRKRITYAENDPEEEYIDEPKYLRKWKKCPGDEGFRAYAVKRFRQYLADSQATFGIKCTQDGSFQLQAYQLIIQYLVSPFTPIKRMLLVHKTGSGKTLTILRVLNNFYDDNRPKVIIFPNDSVRDNFYTELMNFPNKYRDYVERKMNKSSRSIPDILAMSKELQKAGQPGFLASPLRALTYRVAGGSTVLNGRPKRPLFKIGYNGKNAYSNKIVMMDEFHNIRTNSDAKLKALRKALYTAKNTILLGATATPIQTSTSDLDELLKVIKGSTDVNKNDEGFLSYYYQSPFPAYPKHWPVIGELPCIRKVILKGQNLNKYGLWSKKNKNQNDRAKLMQKMLPICQASTSSLGMRAGFVKGMKDDMESYATKVHAVMELVKEKLAKKERVLIMAHKAGGYKAVQIALEHDPDFNTVCQEGKQHCYIALYKQPAKSKTDNRLKRFNRKDAREMLVLANSDQYAEGVTFKRINHLIIVDTPMTFTHYLQIMGRAARLCSHVDAPDAKMKVTHWMFVATHPDKSIQTADEYFLELLKNQLAVYKEQQKYIQSKSTDKLLLSKF